MAKLRKSSPWVSGGRWRPPPTNASRWRLELVEEAAREARAGILALAPLAAARSPRQQHPDALILDGMLDGDQVTVEAPHASPQRAPPAATPGAAEEMVRRWEGRACRNVFAASLDIARPKFDPASGMLVPDTQARLPSAAQLSASTAHTL